MVASQHVHTMTSSSKDEIRGGGGGGGEVHGAVFLVIQGIHKNY